MQCTLDASSLKPFVRALTCISKIGDNLDIFAGPESFSISTASAAKSAFGRFRYQKQFFSRYSLTNQLPPKQDHNSSHDDDEDFENTALVNGQLLVKSLLSILKHRTLEKTVEKCELSIVEGAPRDPHKSSLESDDANVDSLESKLVVKLFCKYGIVKTHRLPLNSADVILAPAIPRNAERESSLTIGPRAMKDIVDHFPGQKSDSRLVWKFDDVELTVKSVETSESRGKQHLSTELTMGASDFEQYDIEGAPLTVAFYLREFNATIMYAESMSLPLQLRFTSCEPLVISVMDDSCESIFIISTTRVSASALSQTPSLVPQGRKRSRDPSREPSAGPVPFRTPARIVQRTRPVEILRQERASSATGSHFSRPPFVRAQSHDNEENPHNPPGDDYDMAFPPPESPLSRAVKVPLFLPSQQSNIPPEDWMDADAMAAFLDDDGGEEVGFGSQKPKQEVAAEDSFEPLEDAEDELMATQWHPRVQEVDPMYKTFQPLFKD